MQGDIHLTYQAGTCSEFTQKGKKSDRNIIIAPLKILEKENETLLKSGCNMWKACENPECQYSLAAYSNSK
jgi:hypothetical protein